MKKLILAIILIPTLLNAQAYWEKEESKEFGTLLAAELNGRVSNGEEGRDVTFGILLVISRQQVFMQVLNSFMPVNFPTGYTHNISIYNFKTEEIEKIVGIFEDETTIRLEGSNYSAFQRLCIGNHNNAGTKSLVTFKNHSTDRIYSFQLQISD